MRGVTGAVTVTDYWLGGNHHVSILTMNGDKLPPQAVRRATAAGAEQNQATGIIDPDTGEITTT